MKQIHSAILSLVVTLLSHASFAQNETINSDLKIEIMDQERIQKIIASDNRLQYIVISTTGCGGTPYTLKYMKEVKQQYKDTVNVLLLFSDPLKDSLSVKEYARKHNLQGLYYIINPKYKEKGDDRKKGHYFKNTFCQVCENDVIGTPYNILIKNGKILFHGSRFVKNPIPADIVTYFVR